jgi:hypothetical protein
MKRDEAMVATSEAEDMVDEAAVSADKATDCKETVEAFI